jgi:hypothetical protein
MRQIQISIRTLLIATALIAVVLGYHVDWIRQRNGFRRCSQVTFSKEGPASPQMPFALKLLGDSEESSLFILNPLPGEIQRAKRLFPEAKVTFWNEIDESEFISQ